MQIAFDAFAETLQAAALAGAAQPIVSISLMKALYGIRENETVQPMPNPLGEAECDTAQLMEKYSKLIMLDEEDDADG